jgi:hypothetical protein
VGTRSVNGKLSICQGINYSRNGTIEFISVPGNQYGHRNRRIPQAAPERVIKMGREARRCKSTRTTRARRTAGSSRCRNLVDKVKKKFGAIVFWTVEQSVRRTARSTSGT